MSFVLTVPAAGVRRAALRSGWPRHAPCVRLVAWMACAYRLTGDWCMHHT
jgi:hypothetical protein